MFFYNMDISLLLWEKKNSSYFFAVLSSFCRMLIMHFILNLRCFQTSFRCIPGEIIPYRSLMGMCGKSGYLFLAIVLNRVWFWVKFFKQGIKNRRIFVLSRIMVWGAVPHLPHTAVKRKNPTPLPVFVASNFAWVWRENLQDFCRKML